MLTGSLLRPYEVADAQDDRDAAGVQAVRQFISGTAGPQPSGHGQKPE